MSIRKKLPFKREEPRDDTRINEFIREREVRLINELGEHVGITPIQDALRRAQEATLDLVEVSGKTKPPVCRIMDYGQFKYQQAKKLKEAKKKQKQIVVKEIKLRPRIEPHDYEFKIDHAMKFLEHGDKVRFILQFKGREMAHKGLGMAVMTRVLADLKDHSLIEQDPKEEGRFLNMTLAPLPSAKRKKLATDTSQDLTEEDISLSLMEGIDFDIDEVHEEEETTPKEETEE